MKLTWMIFFLLFIFGCGKKNKIPSDVLPKSRMENILWDMILADRFSSQFILKDSATKNVKLETLKLYDQVFQTHKITKDQFVKSYKYYLTRPDITKVLFDTIAARANRQKPDVYRPQ